VVRGGCGKERKERQRAREDFRHQDGIAGVMSGAHSMNLERNLVFTELSGLVCLPHFLEAGANDRGWTESLIQTANIIAKPPVISRKFASTSGNFSQIWNNFHRWLAGSNKSAKTEPKARAGIERGSFTALSLTPPVARPDTG
jgi:hypothetical protein